MKGATWNEYWVVTVSYCNQMDVGNKWVKYLQLSEREKGFVDWDWSLLTQTFDQVWSGCSWNTQTKFYDVIRLVTLMQLVLIKTLLESHNSNQTSRLSQRLALHAITHTIVTIYELWDNCNRKRAWCYSWRQMRRAIWNGYWRMRIGPSGYADITYTVFHFSPFTAFHLSLFTTFHYLLYTART